MDDNDVRWQAVLEYNTDDDGIWLVADGRDRKDSERINLGFWPTVADVLDAAERLTTTTPSATALGSQEVPPKEALR